MKRTEIVYLARAVVLTCLASISAAFASVFIFIDNWIIVRSSVDNQSRGQHDMWAELIWAPILETLIMMLIWKGVRLLGAHALSAIVFLFVTGSLAFIAHGGYPRGVSPAAVFVVFSIAYVIVSRKHSELYGFFVVSSAHALCNLLFLIGRWARDLG